jgi:hypothetical protein
MAAVTDRLMHYASMLLPAAVDGAIAIAKGQSAEEALMVAAERLASDIAKIKFPDLREG